MRSSCRRLNSRSLPQETVAHADPGNFRHVARGLRPVADDAELPHGGITAIESIADPPRPNLPGEYFADIAEFAGENGGVGLRAISKAVFALIVVVALGLPWRYTPLSEYAEPDNIRGLLDGIAAGPLTPLFVVAHFVLTGFVAFPVTVLIASRRPPSA